MKMTRQKASKIIEQYCMCSSGDCPTLECADCEYNHDPRKVEEAFLMAIDALESAQPEPCEYAVSAMAVEEMLKDLLPERGMWEIEGDEAKTAICETVHDALDGLWKLPFVKPDSKELSFTQKALDTISRQDAIRVVSGLDNSFVKYIEELPSAQPEPCDDCVSRTSVIRLLHSGYHSKSMIEEVKELPSVQPEIKPIDYQDCANAMLRMWMDNVVTDGEYNRIMDKLNAFWRVKNE